MLLLLLAAPTAMCGARAPARTQLHDGSLTAAPLQAGAAQQRRGGGAAPNAEASMQIAARQVGAGAPLVMLAHLNRIKGRLC